MNHAVVFLLTLAHVRGAAALTVYPHNVGELGGFLYLYASSSELLWWHEIEISLSNEQICKVSALKSDNRGKYVACKLPKLQLSYPTETRQQVMVKNQTSQLYLPCVDCFINFQSNLKPTIHSAYHHNDIVGTAGDTFYIVSDENWHLIRDASPQLEIIINQQSTLLNQFTLSQDLVIGNSSKHMLNILIPHGVEAGTHQMEIIVKDRINHSRNVQNDLKFKKFKTESSHGRVDLHGLSLTVVPSIRLVTTYNQQVFNVYGSGFSKTADSNRVVINDMACSVISSDLHFINATCVHPVQAPSPSPQAVFDTGFHLNLELLDSAEDRSGFGSGNDMQQHAVINDEMLWPKANPYHEHNMIFHTFQAEGEAFLYVPMEANYTFSLECSSECDLEFLSVLDGKFISNKTVGPVYLQANQVDRYVLKVKFRHDRHGDSFRLNAALRGVRFDPVPASWFRFSLTSPPSISLSVHNQAAVCRASDGCRINTVARPQDTSRLHSYRQNPSPLLQGLVQRRTLSEGEVLLSQFACDASCVIPKGTRVIVDSSRDFDSLEIRGSLTWDVSMDNLRLATGYLLVQDGGEFHLGSSDRPMLLNAEIYIKDNGSQHPHLGKRFLGGLAMHAAGEQEPRIEIHGRPTAHPWTLLVADGTVGDSSVVVSEDVGADWRAGDRIAIAPTGLPVTTGGDSNHAQVEANRVWVDGQLDQHYMGDEESGLQAEVVHLSRGVVITGDAFDENRHGLHTVMAHGGSMRVTNTRVEKCGQRGVTGRYCLHFHRLHDCTACRFENNVVEDSHQRGIVVHGSHRTTVHRNVLFNVRGAGLYVEDGNEMHNSISCNVNVCPDGSRERFLCRAAGTDNEQADFVQQSGLWALSVTNDFVGNRMVNQYNGFFTQTSAFPNGRGAAEGQVCTKHAPFGVFQGNVHHTNWRFGFYLDNNFPRNLHRSLLSDGLVTDVHDCKAGAWCSCDEFLPDGSDNGVVGRVEDGFDWCNDFVGQYELGDIQYLRFTAINNLKGMYWKQTKNFADGYSSHIKDSTFGWDSSGMPGLPSVGSSHNLLSGGHGAFIIENTRYFGNVINGVIAANQHCQVAGTGSLCTPEFHLQQVDFSRTAPGNKRIVFGASGGNQELSIFTALDGSLDGSRSVVSKHMQQLLELPGKPCRAATGQEAVHYDGGILCDHAARRLQVWSADQGTLSLVGPAGAALEMRWMSTQCSNCYHSTKVGYGAVVLTGYTYHLEVDLQFQPSSSDPPVTIEFSDLVYGTRFDEIDSIDLFVNGQRCMVDSQHSRRFIGPFGPKAAHSGACLVEEEATATVQPSSAGDELMWSDEFDGHDIDLSNWDFDVFGAYRYNNELQAYTSRKKNAFVQDGLLHVVAWREDYGSAKYTSARLVSRRRKDWKYGRIEIRASLPVGQGLWPALWMLNSEQSDWPSSGEIDIMEHVSCNVGTVHSTVHTGAYNHMIGTQLGGEVRVEDVTQFHVYSVDWTADAVQGFVDGIKFFEFNNDGAGNEQTWPFNQAFHVLINVAVGGDWGGYCLEGQLPTLSQQGETMLVDYVRVYGSPPTTTTCTQLGGDPWGSGDQLACCVGTTECVKEWSPASRPGDWYYLCVESVLACDQGVVTLSSSPSIAPSTSPSIVPSTSPSIAPSTSPSIVPSTSPSIAPSTSPSIAPSTSPSIAPSTPPSIVPSTSPSIAPSTSPSIVPSTSPSIAPSTSPSICQYSKRRACRKARCKWTRKAKQCLNPCVAFNEEGMKPSKRKRKCNARRACEWRKATSFCAFITK